MNVYRIVLAALALVVGGQAKAEVVTGNAVNCREAPAATARVLQKLHRGQEVSVERYEGSWALLDDLECWASAAYLSNTATPSGTDSDYRVGDPWQTSTRRSTGVTGASGVPSARLQTSRSSTSRSSFASTRSSSGAKRSSSRSRGGYSGGSCPCGSGNICVGPRGGRYCITSGGNKRYGM